MGGEEEVECLEDPPLDFTPRPTCSNCGHRGHLGHECKAYFHKNVPNYPFVIKYDQDIAIRNSSRRDQNQKSSRKSMAQTLIKEEIRSEMNSETHGETNSKIMSAAYFHKNVPNYPFVIKHDQDIAIRNSSRTDQNQKSSRKSMAQTLIKEEIMSETNSETNSETISKTMSKGNRRKT